MKNLLKIKERIFEKTSGAIGRFFILFFTSIVCAIFLSPIIERVVTPENFQEGEVATRTVRAPSDLVVEDLVQTQKKRIEAERNVSRVFLFSSLDREEFIHSLESILASFIDQEVKTDLLSEKEIQIIRNSEKRASLRAIFLRHAFPILNRGIIESKEQLEAIYKEGLSAVLRDKRHGYERELPHYAIYDLEEATEVFKESISLGKQEIDNELADICEKISSLVIRPNVFFDLNETKSRILKAESQVEPVYRVERKGEVIVRGGDVLSSFQVERLKVYAEKSLNNNAPQEFISIFLICLASLFGSVIVTEHLFPEFSARNRDYGLVALTMIGSVGLLKLLMSLEASVVESASFIQPKSLLLLAPIAAGGMLLQVTIGEAAFIMFTLGFSMLSGVLIERSWLLLLVIILGNIIAAVSVRSSSRRATFILAGLRVGILNVFLVLCFAIFESGMSISETLNLSLWAALGGLFSGLLAGGITPIAEFLGHYVTDSRLLELASLDQPLLRELSVQAPGTWNHSMVVGQMCEAACEAIGAHALLARVGAYYHDIGKADKPAYFIENQIGENRHDKLTPSMSALIIKSHVKEGLEKAKEHRLPRVIIEFIEQHHGTSLIEYFYEKALKEKEEDEIVEETHFRYPGPKPQSKEVAVLMLADCVEATSRTLTDPSPAKLQGLVQKIINKIFASGELDESLLTLKDLHMIAKTFIRVLSGIYHRRIEYSEQNEKANEKEKQSTESNQESQRIEGRPNSETDSKKRANEALSRRNSEEASKGALKRLGL